MDFFMLEHSSKIIHIIFEHTCTAKLLLRYVIILFRREIIPGFLFRVPLSPKRRPIAETSTSVYPDVPPIYLINGNSYGFHYF